MHKKKMLVFALFAPVFAIGLPACVAVTEMTDAGENVQTISEAQAASCEFIESISASNMNTLSKNPEADARARAANEVAELGGDSLHIKSTDLQVSSSGIGGIFSLTGEAYKCS